MDATDDASARKFIKKAIARMDAPMLDAPLMVLEEQVLWFRFVLDDIAAIRITDCAGAIIYSFPRSRFQAICDLLLESRPGRFSMHPELRELRIELQDGRVAILGLYEDQVIYKDRSHYWHAWEFAMSNGKLMPFVEEAIRDHAAGIYEQ